MCKIVIKTPFFFFPGNVLKAQSSINILEFGSFQLRKSISLFQNCGTSHEYKKSIPCFLPSFWKS